VSERRYFKGKPVPTQSELDAAYAKSSALYNHAWMRVIEKGVQVFKYQAEHVSVIKSAEVASLAAYKAIFDAAQAEVSARVAGGYFVVDPVPADHAMPVEKKLTQYDYIAQLLTEKGFEPSGAEQVQDGGVVTTFYEFTNLDNGLEALVDDEGEWRLSHRYATRMVSGRGYWDLSIELEKADRSAAPKEKHNGKAA